VHAGRPHRLEVRTSPFQGENAGSIPAGDATPGTEPKQINTLEPQSSQLWMLLGNPRGFTLIREGGDHTTNRLLRELITPHVAPGASVLGWGKRGPGDIGS
jgi:hypothetical protein